MTTIEETELPGVGVRHDFLTRGGRRVGVISHRAGYRQLLVYSDDDPDACSETLRLEEDDSHALADLLGASRVTRTLDHLQQSVEGLTLDWVPVESGSASASRNIGDTQLRQRTGVSIVAVVRGGETVPAPEPDFRLEAGDTAVVVGTPDGIREAFALLQGG